MAHFFRPNGRLDKTYPNQYGWAHYTSQLVKQNYKARGSQILYFKFVWMSSYSVGIVDLVELTFSPTYLFENRNVPTATAPVQTGAQMRERSRTIVRASQQTWVQLL